MDASARSATSEYSRGRRPSRAAPTAPSALGWAAFAVAVAGALLLIVSEFEPLLHVKAGMVVQSTVAGRHHHSFDMGLIGLVALPMAWGAGRRGSRPAMIALAVLGILAAVLALVSDLPDTTQAGVVSLQFANATASAQVGFYLETIGGALLVIASGALLLLRAPGGDGAGSAAPPADLDRSDAT